MKNSTQSDKIETKTPHKISKAKKKKLMIEVLKNQLGIVSVACRQVGIHRDTHYKWMKEDENYKHFVEEAEFEVKDFGEHSLFKLIKEGNPAAVIFFNKTKNRDRGYIEKREIEHSTNDFKVEINIPKEVKDLI